MSGMRICARLTSCCGGAPTHCSAACRTQKTPATTSCWIAPGCNFLPRTSMRCKTAAVACWDAQTTGRAQHDVAGHLAGSDPIFIAAKINGMHYRILTLHGLRVVDPGDKGGGTPRHILVVYGARTRDVWHQVRNAIVFFLALQPCSSYCDWRAHGVVAASWPRADAPACGRGGNNLYSPLEIPISGERQ